MFLPKSLVSSLESHLTGTQCPSCGCVWKLQELTASSPLGAQREAAYVGVWSSSQDCGRKTAILPLFCRCSSSVQRLAVWTNRRASNCDLGNQGLLLAMSLAFWLTWASYSLPYTSLSSKISISNSYPTYSRVAWNSR